MTNSYPANINTKNNNYKECNMKCSYVYDYYKSNLIYVPLHGMGVAYTISDNSESSYIKYNKNEYKLMHIYIFARPVHTYNNNDLDGELVLYHISKISGQLLYVNIPIIKTRSKGLLNNSKINSLIENTNFQRPNKEMNITTFTLNDVIPKKTEYYNYNIDSYADVIIFPEDKPIYIDSNLFEEIEEVFKIKKGPARKLSNDNNIYINKKGAEIVSSKGNDIYIECNPTDAEGEELIEKEKSTGSPTKGVIQNVVKKILKLFGKIKISGETVKTVFTAILGLLIFIAISIAIHYIFTYIDVNYIQKAENAKKVIQQKALSETKAK